MHFISKKVALLLLAVTSVASSRALFFFFDDPEGPNLVVVLGMAAFLYLLSLTVYVLGSKAAGHKRFLFAVSIQILLAACLYFFLR